MDIAVPTGWDGYTVPFTMQQRGKRFRPKAPWTLWSHAAIVGTTAQYVSTAGSDAADGLSWATAKRSIGTAANVAGTDLIYVAAGEYGNGYGVSALATRDQAFIGVGGPVRCNVDLALTAWTASGSYSYRATTTQAIGQVYDWAASSLDANGFPLRYTAVADAATVDATPGSYWKDAGNNLIYVRCLDDRAPDSNIKVCRSNTNLVNLSADNHTYYFMNFIFEHGTNRNVRCFSASATGGLKVYFKNCIFRCHHGSYNALNNEGVAEMILENCQAYDTLKDGFNYTALNGVAPTVIEINCESHHHGTTGDTTMNASTSHLASRVVRINGKYYATYGPIVVDVNSSKSWNLGCEAYGGLIASGTTAKSNFYIDGSMWLDSCWSHDHPASGFDLVVEAAGDELYYKNLVSQGDFSNGGGTLTTY